MFPTSVIAGMFGFAPAALFEIGRPEHAAAPRGRRRRSRVLQRLADVEASIDELLRAPAPGRGARRSRLVVLFAAGRRSASSPASTWWSAFAFGASRGRPVASWCSLVAGHRRHAAGHRGWHADPSMIALRGGGGHVAPRAGRRCRSPPNTTDPQLRRLRQRGRGDGDRLRGAGAAAVRAGARARHQRVRGRLVARGRRGRRHRGRAGPAQPRRAAGRDRARVQPHPQRRHAAEHPADRAALSASCCSASSGCGSCSSAVGAAATRQGRRAARWSSRSRCSSLGFVGLFFAGG